MRELVDNSCEYSFNEVFVLEDMFSDVSTGTPGYELTGRGWRAEREARARIVEEGPVRDKVEVCGRILNSFFRQELIIYYNLPRIDATTQIEWDGMRAGLTRQD